MRKISDITPTATAEGEFTEGSVATGIAPTILPAEWFNVIQRELVNVVLAAGLKLDPENDKQVLAAVKKMFAGIGANSDITSLNKLDSMVLNGGTLNGLASQADILAGTLGKVVDASGLNSLMGTGLASASGYFTVPVILGDAIRKFYVQWIGRMAVPQAPSETVMSTVTWTYPVAFPNACLNVMTSMAGVTSYSPKAHPVSAAATPTPTSVVLGSGYWASTSSISALAIGY